MNQTTHHRLRPGRQVMTNVEVSTFFNHHSLIGACQVVVRRTERDSIIKKIVLIRSSDTLFCERCMLPTFMQLSREIRGAVPLSSFQSCEQLYPIACRDEYRLKSKDEDGLFR